jgi:RNA polymerase sigma-70 factor (ECF subfamily)
LQQLYKEYRGAIYLYLYAMCQNAALAEDLTQDTFVKALLSLPDGHGNVRAWLYMVARNLYFNHRKREKNNICWDEIEKREDISCDDLLEKTIWTEKQSLLFRGINQLSPNKREVLQLQYFGGTGGENALVFTRQQAKLVDAKQKLRLLS